MRLLIGTLVSISAICISGCASTGTLDSGYSGSLQAWDLTAAGQDLGDRLRIVDARPPVFGSRSNLSQLEARTLVRYSNAVPNAKFIFGGRPTFLIDVESAREYLDQEVVRLKYSITLKHASSGQVVSQSSSAASCFLTEALVSAPPPCRKMKPVILQKALEQL